MEFAGSREPAGDDFLDYRRSRSLSQIRQQLLQRRPLAFGHDLHRAGRRIADKADKPQPLGNRYGEVPKADPLDPSLDSSIESDHILGSTKLLAV